MPARPSGQTRVACSCGSSCSCRAFSAAFFKYFVRCAFAAVGAPSLLLLLGHLRLLVLRLAFVLLLLVLVRLMVPLLVVLVVLVLVLVLVLLLL